MHVAVVNCGSTTLRVDCFEDTPDGPRRTTPTESVDLRADGPTTREVAIAVRRILSSMIERRVLDPRSLAAVGHRVVHGGLRFRAATLIDDDVLDAIAAASTFAPLHNSAALAAIQATREVLGPSVAMVASFDTAFHRDLPEHAATYAIEWDLTRRHGLRRFGFHGIAHQSMLRSAVRLCGRPAEHLRMVSLQLGGGCSAAAVAGGRSLDVSMGLTPLEGLVMGTRTGDVDPTLVAVIARLEGLDVTAVEERFNTHSGLLGVSGTSPDMRVLLEEEARNPRAALAIQMFCARARKYLGAYLAVLGGADVVVFGGGIGEHAPTIRARICADMEWAGLELDAAANAAAVGVEARVDTSTSRIAVVVASVDEAAVIAGEALSVVGAAR